MITTIIPKHLKNCFYSMLPGCDRAYYETKFNISERDIMEFIDVIAAEMEASLWNNDQIIRDSRSVSEYAWDNMGLLYQDSMESIRRDGYKEANVIREVIADIACLALRNKLYQLCVKRVEKQR